MKKLCLNCNCYSHEHDIWFEYDEKEPNDRPKSFYVLFSFQPRRFLERVKIALRYIFKNDSGVFSDAVWLEKDVEKLQVFLQEFRDMK